MSTTVRRTPKSGRQSLFFQDLASPISTHRGKFATPGQAAAVSALWRENFGGTDPPPPPVFTLEDRADFSPESGIPDYPISPESKSELRTPVRDSRRDSFSSLKSKSEASTSFAVMGGQQMQHSPASSSWWSPGKSGGGDHDEKGKGSPVEGVVQPGALITLPPPREVARPELQRNILPASNLDEEEWNRSDAQKALSKNGVQINGILIIGVKPLDPIQRQTLNEKLNNQGFMTLPLPSSNKNSELSRASPRPYYLQNNSNSAQRSVGAIASPAKSVVSKIMDLILKTISDTGLFSWLSPPSPTDPIWNLGGFCGVSSPVPRHVCNSEAKTVRKVPFKISQKVVAISAGEAHTLALTGDGRVYSWGRGTFGRLGTGKEADELFPVRVEFDFKKNLWVFIKVACGNEHIVALRQIDTIEQKESMCWTFGLGDKGQLGHGTTNSMLLPKSVKQLPQDVFLISLDCGLFHTSVVSSDGDVWSWGMEKGLGLFPDVNLSGIDGGDAVNPLRISCELYEPKFVKPMQVACGAAHTVLVARDGYRLWSWGRGRSGALGTGNTVDSLAPSIVKWPTLDEDFKEGLETVGGEEKVEENDSGRVMEMDKSLTSAMEEMQLLRSKLAIMEQYASILHGSIYGKPLEERDIPPLLQKSGTFDIAKEWENLLDSADHGKLVRLEMFYRNMLAGVKDKLMKRKIQEMIKECLDSSTKGNHVSI
ncbi:hypothetical protein HHK36_021666 [Tetracentron sinense]|uniref:RRM Nup35-type domain-containing protein n=1 Tax=Tetracentron sinense TaxID=13715 RepID=A0A835DA57_TETSI|nr:hypothetical protein HHK36_021666 [Tetracentron sinense]